MARKPDNGLMYMGISDIESTARAEEAGLRAADQILDKYDPDATIGRIANRVVNLLSWLKPDLRERVLDEARDGIREARHAAE